MTIAAGNTPSRGWLLFIGVALVALGVIGLGMTFTLTAVTIFWFGILAIVAGAVQIVDAFGGRGFGGTVWNILIGIAYIIAGILLITMPISSAFWLTLFVAASFVVGGVFRMAMAFTSGMSGGTRIWFILSGILSIILGIMIYGFVMPSDVAALATPEGQLQWLSEWGWVLGMFVAIEFLVAGMTYLAAAFTLDRA
jgi:uncharacterized membrane protein HdeD (DUF308 family)